MSRQVLELPTVCDSDAPSSEGCERCVRNALRHTPGIREVLQSQDGVSGPKSTGLRIVFDPAIITRAQLSDEVRRAGLLCQSAGRAHITLKLEGMASPRAERVIEDALADLPTVSASASYPTGTLRVGFDRTACALPEIVRRLDHLGYRIRPMTGRQAAELKDDKPRRREIGNLVAWLRFFAAYHKLTMAIVGGLALLVAVIVKYSDGPSAIRFTCLAVSYVVAGYYTAIDTFQVLRRFRLDIDVLMFAAALGAAAIGHFEEGAFLLVLFALGGAGEELAMDRARHAIEALGKLAPDTAIVRDAFGDERRVPVDSLQPDQRVVVRPYDRLPADGEVEEGTSSIDQSPITGESVPVEKQRGDAVFAGTINGDGLLVVRVTRQSAESTLAKIVRLVNEAQSRKSPTQLFAEKLEKRYVPLVLAATALLIVLPPLLGGNWVASFYRAMAFLTAASPCALAIGTPAAVLSGIARAAQIGVLVKGGVHLENLARVRAVAFDKTGTLTTGRPTVIDVVPLDDSTDERTLLALAATVDAHASHPAAIAIVDAARKQDIALLTATNATTLAGRGASAVIADQTIFVGKLSPEIQRDPRIGPLTSNGQMIALVSRDDVALGVIVLADVPRGNASKLVAALHAMDIRPCVMLTGDRRAVAEPIAKSLGIDEVRSDLMPDDKLRIIGELQAEHGAIAMVGDGVNDAPALAAASIGIAMGGAGTDVAIEVADIALMSDDLGKLPDAISLARFTRRVITQNLVIALGVIVVLAPIAAIGLTNLGVAVLFHEGSTVVVVLNALRLLAFRPRGTG